MATVEPMAGGEFERLSPQETRERIEAGEAILLDIRRIDEFHAARIPGAVLAVMEEMRPETLPLAGKQVILQCRSGARTAMTAEQLISRGFCEKIAHLEGGILAWREAGLPVTVFDPASGAYRTEG